MKLKNPPAVAVWMLEHLTFADGSQALAGDLLEEFRSGRSAGWYWRQVLMAIAVGASRQIRDHWLALIFAALWSLPSFAFQFYVVRWMAESTFVSARWKLAWPYSTITDIAYNWGCDVLYLWCGLAVYFLISALARKGLYWRDFSRALRISLLVFIVMTAALLALAVILPAPTPLSHVSLGKLIMVQQWQGTVFRSNYFLALLISAWMAFSGREDEPAGLSQERQ